MEETSKLFLDLVGNLGALGFIFWLVWRTTNHTIPRLAESFEKAVEAARKDYREASTQERADFMDALERQRQATEVQMGVEREHQKSQTDKLVDALKDLKDDLRNR
jgi:predicted negative regulator of RcsB-dependent stress response